MKKRNQKRAKLSLNRDTVTKLTSENMTEIQGGVLYNANDMKCTGCPSGCGIEPE
jgi:hypothetical protein